MPLSVPAYAAKTRLQQLCTAEIFVVAVVRLRADTPAPSGCSGNWRHGMTAAGVSEQGCDAFDMLMHLLTPSLQWPGDIRSLHCGGLGAAEARLLQAIGALQHEHGERIAEDILAHWLPPGETRIATQYLRRFADAMTQARLVVPQRYDAPARSFSMISMPPTRGSALLH